MRRLIAALLGAAAMTASLGAANPAAAAAACANEAIRAEQQWASNLPDCRAYEQVSPMAKNGYSVQRLPSQDVGFGALDGGRFRYQANGAFPGAPVSFFNTTYLATRGAANWDSPSISVPELTIPGVRPDNVLVTSDDFSHSLVSSSLALTPGAVEGNYNLFVKDNTTGALELIRSFAVEPPLLRAEDLIGGTPDFDHIVFTETGALTTDAPDNGKMKLYEFSDGTLRLVSIFPDGTPATEPVYLRGVGRPNLGHLISADGSRVFFNVGEMSCSLDVGYGCEGLYVREGDQTIPISASQRSGEVGEIKDGLFRDASPDGSVVYFTSRAPLTDESWSGPLSPDGDGSLYRYDLETGELRDLTVSHDPENSSDPGIFSRGTSDTPPLATADGSTVVFIGVGKLTPNAIEGNQNVYVWHQGKLSLALSTSTLNYAGRSSEEPRRVLSPNGMHLVLMTDATDVMGEVECPADGFSPKYAAGPCRRIYEYDVAEDRLRCASCPQSPSIAWAHANIGIRESNPVTNDGTVFFQTPMRLVAADGNGQRDVYEWHDGVQRLISSGGADTPSLFLAASPDGNDVYFSTQQRLVPQDTDNLADAYDARVDGGLSTQMVSQGKSSSCIGDDCLPPPSPAKAPPAMTSAQFHGPASKPARKAHHKKKARKKKHAGKKRHAAKRGKKAQRHARHDQRSGK